MSFSRSIRIFILFLMCLGISFPGFAKTLNVGIVFDGPSDSTLAFVSCIDNELPNAISRDNEVVFKEKFAGKFDSNNIKSGLTKLMNAKDIDVVLAIGPVASHIAANMDKYNKPVIASHIYNASMQKLSQKGGTSGKKNLSYIDMNLDISKHIEKFQEIRTFKKLHILISPYMLNGVPQLADSLKAQTEKTGVTLEILPSNTKAYDISLKMKDAEAVYVAPLPDLPEEHRCMVIARINELKVPTMAMFGRDMLDCGVLCTIATGIDTQKLARRIANNLSRILSNEDPANFPIAFTHTQRMTINMETCRKVGVYPSFSQMSDADIVNEEADTERKISITQAIETALSKNLTKLAKQHEVRSQKHSLDKARAALVPRGNTYIREVAIDEDRAESMLTPAEYSTQIGANLRYTIISEDGKANVDVQKYLLAAKKDEERALILDIIQDAAISYLNVLKTKTLKNIQTDNLEVTKANLELAKQREKAGSAGPAEVYRWEIQMASARQSVVEASAKKRKSELALNEALSAKQDQPFNTLEDDLFSDIFFFDYNRVAPYIDNVLSFDIFSDFLVEDSFVFSPELSAINHNLEAAARNRRAHRRRQQHRPTLDLQGNFTRTFHKNGAGEHKPYISDVNLPLSMFTVKDPKYDGKIPNVSMPLHSLFKFPDDNDWQVALSLTFPIFDGALTGAALREADDILDSLRSKRDAVMQKLELKTRVSLEDAKASFISIKLAKQRVEYAGKALDVVRSAYSRGAIDILDLIDAQNGFRIAKEAYANAVFTFLSDFVHVCRSVGTFDFIMNQRTNNEYYERIEAYFKSRNIAVTNRSIKETNNAY